MNDTSWISDISRMTQIKNFNGLKWGTGFPMDVDGLLEWKDKLYVIFELKLPTAKMLAGQERAYTRLTDDLQKVKPTIFIEAMHTESAKDQIDCAQAKVRRYYFEGKWVEVYGKKTLFAFITTFLKKYGGLK